MLMLGLFLKVSSDNRIFQITLVLAFNISFESEGTAPVFKQVETNC